MKKPAITTLLIILTGLFLVSATAAIAQTDASGASEQFASRCGRAQRNLRGPVRDQDIRTRVDRLQAYRYISRRLDIFTQRLENNDQPSAQELRQQVSQLDESIDEFAASYETYDGMRDSLSRMANCGDNAELFQTRLSDVRQARSAVNTDVAKIHTTLDTNVRNQISDLISKLEANQQLEASQ